MLFLFTEEKVEEWLQKYHTKRTTKIVQDPFVPADQPSGQVNIFVHVLMIHLNSQTPHLN